MGMNSNHARLCPSPEWAEHIQNEILPEVTCGIDLGQDMLEIGPGPARPPSGSGSGCGT